MRKRAFIIILLTAMIVNSLTGSVAMASGGIDDNATGGGSSSGLTSGNGSLNWNQNKSGYRFSVIDNSGNVMSLGLDGKPGSVDIFFMNYNDINTPYYFTSIKTQPLSDKAQNKKLTIEELNKVAKFNSLPPYPISTDGNGNAKGEGEALKKWLMAGEKWIGRRTTSSVGSSSNKGSSSNTANSNLLTPKYDVAKAKTDIINSAKELKTRLDDNGQLDKQTRLSTIHSWMDQLALYYTNLYKDKKITKADYDEILLGTALDMMAYMQHSNFTRKFIYT